MHSTSCSYIVANCEQKGIRDNYSITERERERKGERERERERERAVV